MNTESYLRLIKLAYPAYIIDFSSTQVKLIDESIIDIFFDDNTAKILTVTDNLSDVDRMITDLGRFRLHKLLGFMYGETEEQVRRNLVEITWLPKTVNKKILVTNVNDVDKKLQLISCELDLLPKKFRKYFIKLSGTFNFRNIKDSDALSPHSYGIAIDLNKQYGNYWKWDLDKGLQLTRRNKIPSQVVRVFEKNGFIWGGRWTSYDTMHFEYRPEFSIDRKKRVLILSRGGMSYGSETQLSRLVNNIDQSKYELHLITIEKCINDFSIYSKLTFDLPAWGKLKNLISKYRTLKKLVNYANQENIDLIHCSYQWLYPYAKHIGKTLNIPVILHIRRPNNRNNLIKRYSSADKIICISRRIFQEFLVSGYKKDDLLFIPDSISDSFHFNTSKSALKAKYGLSKKFIVAIIGRIYESKKHHLFIKLAESLSRQFEDVEFLIVGGVDNQNYYEEIKELARVCNAKITFTGHVDDMGSIFNAIDILVSFAGGSVMYEAMAWGKVVISIGFVKKNTSTYLIDKKTAFVIENNSLEIAINAITEVLEDEKLYKLISSQASELIKQSLFPKMLSKKVEEAYEKLG
jgi:peptidoglycan L-alanyl-D-glutamate endopeptidase CwlK